MYFNTLNFAVLGFIIWIVLFFTVREKINQYKQIIVGIMLALMVFCIYFFKELLPLTSGLAGGAFLGNWLQNIFSKKPNSNK